MKQNAISLILIAIALVAITVFMYRCITVASGVMDHSGGTSSVNATGQAILANVTNSTGVAAEDNLTVPARESLLNDIGWSKYRLVYDPRVSEARVAGPNMVVNHTFVLVSYDVEVKAPDDVAGVLDEMSDVVAAGRRRLGPDSSVEVWGHVDGRDAFHAIMIPYDNMIYRYDYFHPPNNLTFTKVEAQI